MKKTLVLGFGNVYRRDDGVGVAIVNRLRQMQGLPALGGDDDGFDELGRSLDTIVLHQLVPELVNTLVQYELIIFLDAHVSSYPEAVREEQLVAEYRLSSTLHQFHPSTLLALAIAAGSEPAGVLISVRGHDFDFGEGLSPETEAHVEAVAKRVAALADWTPGEDARAEPD